MFRPPLSYGNIPYRNNLQAYNATHVWFIYRIYQNIFHIFVIYLYTFQESVRLLYLKLC